MVNKLSRMLDWYEFLTVGRATWKLWEPYRLLKLNLRGFDCHTINTLNTRRCSVLWSVNVRVWFDSDNNDDADNAGRGGFTPPPVVRRLTSHEEGGNDKKINYFWWPDVPKMHQIAQICANIFKNFPGVTPPDPHYWGGVSLLPRFLTINERPPSHFQSFRGRWCNSLQWCCVFCTMKVNGSIIQCRTY